ncbi:hypothetical protein OAF98_03000 [Planctomicrobium sp.]|nr:hypothetical protein [Planctomicrobium sp.]MDB4743430.1 hypothetical protein [Planctomicrobium sp.]
MTSALLGYIFFLLANAMLFIRPSELFPALGNLQVYLAFIVCSIVFSIQAIHNQLCWKTLIQQPVNFCVLGITLSVLVSRLSTGNFDGIDTGFITMVKILLYYLLLVGNITSPTRLRYFLMSTAFCATFMIA